MFADIPEERTERIVRGAARIDTIATVTFRRLGFLKRALAARKPAAFETMHEHRHARDEVRETHVQEALPRVDAGRPRVPFDPEVECRPCREARRDGPMDEGYAASQLWLADWDRFDGETLYHRARGIAGQLDPLRQT